MPKLSDSQSILLSAASQREPWALYPIPDCLSSDDDCVTKAIAGLIKAGFAEEQGEGAVFATPTGLKAIGIETDLMDCIRPSLPQARAKRKTKSAAVLSMLQRECGATLPELVAATGWLPHTTRAALTGLRKRGHAITRSKRDDVTCYVIEAAI